MFTIRLQSSRQYPFTDRLTTVIPAGTPESSGQSLPPRKRGEGKPLDSRWSLPSTLIGGRNDKRCKSCPLKLTEAIPNQQDHGLTVVYAVLQV
jgi:hypothetical protein